MSKFKNKMEETEWLLVTRSVKFPRLSTNTFVGADHDYKSYMLLKGEDVFFLEDEDKIYFVGLYNKELLLNSDYVYLGITVMTKKTMRKLGALFVFLEYDTDYLTKAVDIVEGLRKKPKGKTLVTKSTELLELIKDIVFERGTEKYGVYDGNIEFYLYDDNVHVFSAIQYDQLGLLNKDSFFPTNIGGLKHVDSRFTSDKISFVHGYSLTMSKEGGIYHITVGPDLDKHCDYSLANVNKEFIRIFTDQRFLPKFNVTYDLWLSPVTHSESGTTLTFEYTKSFGNGVERLYRIAVVTTAMDSPQHYTSPYRGHQTMIYLEETLRENGVGNIDSDKFLIPVQYYIIEEIMANKSCTLLDILPFLNNETVVDDITYYRAKTTRGRPGFDYPIYYGEMKDGYYISGSTSALNDFINVYLEGIKEQSSSKPKEKKSMSCKGIK